jgi:hypothetical protein
MRGANDFFEYQTLVKAPSTIASLLVRDQNYSVLRAGRSMQVALMEHGVSIHKSTCREHVKKSIDIGYVGLDPNVMEANRCHPISKRISPKWLST